MWEWTVEDYSKYSATSTALGKFFAGEVFAVRLKKRNGPGLAHFFSTVRKSDLRNFSNCLA
jgi:hypothetical protein